LPKLTRLTAKESEAMPIANGFTLIRSKGSHRIYRKKNKRVVIPFHAGKILHPKIIRQVLKAIDETYV